MKCIILCAGYATRLYPLTLSTPKPLLPVAGKPILEHLLDRIMPLADIDEIIIVTNAKFYSAFEQWLNGYKNRSAVAARGKAITIVDDNTASNEDRLGGLGDLLLVVRERAIEDDLLVIAGDNLFDLDLDEFMRACRSGWKAGIVVHEVKNIEEAKKFGVVAIDASGQINDFEEKPTLPKSRLISTGVYFYAKELIPLIEEYSISGSMDGPGMFIKWLYPKLPVLGFPFKGKWFDIGSFENLERASKEFR